MNRIEQNQLLDELRDYDENLPREVWDGICRQAADEIQQLRAAREQDRARIAELEGALREIAGVTAPLESLEINHRLAVEIARSALDSSAG